MIQQPNYAPGMRHASAELRNRAERLSAVLSRLDSQVGSMSYSGPAADRFRASMADHRINLVMAHQRITETADILARSAQNIETGMGGLS